ncbi:hypothetical protein, partial [Nocardiopsis tropica]
DPPATNPDRGPDSPAPKDTPGTTPAPKDTPPAPPSLNKDLAEVFGRHNDEFLAPYNPASPVGAGAFDNAAKAAAARQDFADVFARNFGDHLGEAAARDLGRDYADTLARHWNDPNLGQHLRDTLGDRLPPHMRDHLADVPTNLQKPLGDYFSTTNAYTQQVGGSIGTGALEGYLGEGLGSLADGRGWEASGYSATAGATQAGIQQGATDGILHGLDLFSDKDKPNITDPPPTETDSTGNRSDNRTGPETPGPWAGGGEDTGQGGDRSPGPDRDRGGEGPQREDGRGEGPDRGQDGRPDREDGPPATASQGTGDRDDLSDIDDVPDLVSDTDSDTDSDFGDTGSVFGDPDDRDRDLNNHDTVRVHQDDDARTPYPDSGKDPVGTTEVKHPGLGSDLFHPGMNDGPLAVNFLNAIVPDNPMATPPPGTEQTTPEPQAQNPGTEHGDRTTSQERSGPEQHTPAPVVAAPINQAAPTPAGQQPPAPGPQNPASDTGQRSAPTDRNSGERSPQRTGGDTRTTDPSAQRSTRDGDVVRTSTESAPPAPESATTGNTTGNSTGLDNPNSPTDAQRTNPDNAPAPEQRTSSSDTPQPPPPAAEDSNSDGQHDTEDTGHNPSDRDGEQSDERDEGSSGNDDRSQDRDKDQPGDDGNRSGGGEGRGDGDRSGDENNDRSDLEDSEDGKDEEDGKRTDDDAESAHEGDSTTEGDGQERSGEGTSEVTPDSNRPDTQRDPDRPADNGETFGLSPSGSPVPQEGSGSGGRDVQQVVPVGAERSVRFTPPDDADDASVSSPAVSSTGPGADRSVTGAARTPDPDVAGAPVSGTPVNHRSGEPAPVRNDLPGSDRWGQESQPQVRKVSSLFAQNLKLPEGAPPLTVEVNTNHGPMRAEVRIDNLFFESTTRKIDGAGEGDPSSVRDVKLRIRALLQQGVDMRAQVYASMALKRHVEAVFNDKFVLPRGGQQLKVSFDLVSPSSEGAHATLVWSPVPPAADGVPPDLGADGDGRGIGEVLRRLGMLDGDPARGEDRPYVSRRTLERIETMVEPRPARRWSDPQSAEPARVHTGLADPSAWEAARAAAPVHQVGESVNADFAEPMADSRAARPLDLGPDGDPVGLDDDGNPVDLDANGDPVDPATVLENPDARPGDPERFVKAEMDPLWATRRFEWARIPIPEEHRTEGGPTHVLELTFRPRIRRDEDTLTPERYEAYVRAYEAKLDAMWNRQFRVRGDGTVVGADGTRMHKLGDDLFNTLFGKESVPDPDDMKVADSASGAEPPPPGSGDQLHVRLLLADDSTPAAQVHHEIDLHARPGDRIMGTHSWNETFPVESGVHETAHLLGLLDEYFQPGTVFRGSRDADAVRPGDDDHGYGLMGNAWTKRGADGRLYARRDPVVLSGYLDTIASVVEHGTSDYKPPPRAAELSDEVQSDIIQILAPGLDASDPRRAAVFDRFALATDQLIRGWDGERVADQLVSPEDAAARGADSGADTRAARARAAFDAQVDRWRADGRLARALDLVGRSGVRVPASAMTDALPDPVRGELQDVLTESDEPAYVDTLAVFAAGRDHAAGHGPIDDIPAVQGRPPITAGDVRTQIDQWRSNGELVEALGVLADSGLKVAGGEWIGALPDEALRDVAHHLLSGLQPVSAGPGLDRAGLERVALDVFGVGFDQMVHRAPARDLTVTAPDGRQVPVPAVEVYNQLKAWRKQGTLADVLRVLRGSGVPVPDDVLARASGRRAGQRVVPVGAGQSVRFAPPDDADDASVSSPAVSSAGPGADRSVTGAARTPDPDGAPVFGAPVNHRPEEPAPVRADLLRPDGPTTVMAVRETTGESSRDPGPVPLGGTSRDIPLGTLDTDSPATRGDSPTDDRDTTGTENDRDPNRSTQEGPPPPLTYDGGFVPDRSGQSYDLGYLTTSTVLGPHMLFTEHLPGFVDDVLAGTPDMPAPARQGLVESLVDTLNREGPRPFLREGGRTVSAAHDGQTWSADIDLRPEDGDFYHVDTENLSGGGDSRFLRLHDAGPGVDSSDGGSRGAGKTVGAKFTMSPFYITGVNGNDAGPIAAIGGRGGAKVRGTSGSASTGANAASGIELLGAPNLYVGDLHMRASVTGPGLTAPRVQEGTAYNGLTMNLPGEVVSSDAPERIVPDNGPVDANGNHPPVNRPFMGTGHPLEITRFSPVPPASDDGTDGDTAGTTGGNTTSGDGGTDRGGEGDSSDSSDSSDSTTATGGGRKNTLGTWLADHLLGPRPKGNRGGDHTPSRQERRDNGYRERIESTFDNDRVQQYLPQMSNSSAHIRIEFPGGRPRIMQMWSVSTEYNRKDFAPGLADFVHSNTAVKSDSSSVKHSTVASGSIGGGFGIWLELPNGKSVRLDVPFLEYSATFEKSTGTTLSTSGTSSHVVHAPSGHAAYDVKRDFYVRIQGEPDTHRFEADTVEMLTVEDARLLNGEPSKAPTSTDGPTAPPRPPFPNLAVDHPTDLSGATVRGFGHAPPAAPTGNTDNTDTTENNGADGEAQAPPSPQGPFYDDLAYRVLSAISEKRPGMVIPDLARTTKDYAVRPSHMDPEAPVRSFRERWGLRRNADVAQENTLKVIKALSESGIKSGAPDLPGNGIPVRLKESAVIDPTMLRRDKGSRPDAVTVRVYGDFDPLVHQFDTTASGGARFAGSSGITTTKGSSIAHALGLNVGASVRTDAGADARGVPRVLGNPSASLNTSLGLGKGSSQGLSHSSEETVLFTGDSDVWTSRTRFTARLFEHDDIGMARDDRPQREHGIPLLGDGMDAEAVLLTPKMPPMATDSPDTASDPAGTARDGDTATSSGGQETRNTPETATDPRGEDSAQTDASGNTAPDTTDSRQPLTPEQARDMIRRNFVPQTTPGGTPGDGQGGRWTVIRDGAVHTWGRLFGESAQVVTPAPDTTAPPAGTVTTTVADGNRAVVLSPPTPPGTTPGTNDNQAVVLSQPTPPGTTPGTTTSTTQQTDSSGGDRSGDGTPADRTQQNRLPLDQARARAIRDIGGTFERVNTHFDTGSRGMRGLLEETFRTFSEPRGGLYDGFRLKLDSFLSQSSGGGRQFENHLSAEELATSKSATTPSGSRIRQEMSGGFRSPHDVRATVATKVEIDTVTDFRPVDAQMRWNGGTEVSVSTNSSLTGNVGLKFGGSGGRNPNPHPTDDSLPNEAVRPIPLVGPSIARTFFSRGTSNTQATAFTSSVLFIPNITKAYAFRASGHLTQAIEFAKNWSIGPPLSWNTRFHGWTVPVKDLLSGYVHSRDAQQADLVMDKATRDGDRVDLSPQPNPKKPDSAQVRPGFEGSGRQVQPADPGAAIQNLVNDLASNGLELTSGGRELLLQKLTTHLGQNPDSTVPVPVKVRALGTEPGPDSGPRPMRSASPGKVYVNLTRDPDRTDVSYVGQSGYYIESHTWKAIDAHSQNRGTGTTVGADGVLLQPPPYPQDDQGSDGQSGHRPLFTSPAGAVSSSTRDGSSSGVSQDDARTVELHMDTPYAKVRADTTLTLTLELGEPKGGENGNPPRTTYTGTADSGRVETMYPFAYMTFDPPAETTTTAVAEADTQGTGADTLSPPPVPAIATSTDGTGSTGTAPADRDTPQAPEGDSTTANDRTRTDTTGDDRAPADRDTPPAPEGDSTTANNRAPADGDTTQRPPAPIYASVADALRTWARDAGPRPGNDTAITKPAMVQDGGQALRDKANVVIAQTLGWKPPPGTPEGGQPTRATADAARAYLADAYGQDPVHNEIDHSLSESAVKAVYPTASHNAEGLQFTDIGRTEWGAKAVPSSRGAKILDALPGSQLSDSRVQPRSNSAGDSHSGSTGLGSEFRPAGLSTAAEGIPYDGHEGAYTGAPGVNTSASHGAESGSNQAVKGYQESDKLRQGPVYLIEYDTTWAFGAGSKLKAPAAFHPNDPSLPSTPLHKRPTRWGVDDVTVRMAGWYSESDAIAMGFLTPDQAKDMAPVMDRLNRAREEFSQAEAAYADTRAPLEGLAEGYAANPRDPSAEDAYTAQEDKYKKALSDFDDQIDALIETVNNTRTTLGEAGQGTDSGTAPPVRTVGGDGGEGTDRAPATDDTTTGDTGTTTTGNTGADTTTTGGPRPTVTVTSPAPEPTGPGEGLADRFLSELNLRAPGSDSPAPGSDGFRDTEDGLEQNTDTVDARVQRASDAADTAVQEARDARDAANDLATALGRGTTDLRNGTRILTGSDGGAPAAGTGERSPAPAPDSASAPGAIRQAQDAQTAADTAHDNATAADNGITATRNNATGTTPEPHRGAFIERVRTATSEAEDADTAATEAHDTADGHEDTVAELGTDLDATPPRYQALSTAVDGLSGQDRSADWNRAAQDARARADDLISELEGIAGRADTTRAEAESTATEAAEAQADADTAKGAA